MGNKSIEKKKEIRPLSSNDFFRPWNDLFDTNFWGDRMLTVPAVNIAEDKDDFKIMLAVPGMKKDDFEIDMEGNQLIISCEKEDKKEEADQWYTRKEYSYSSFQRYFTLPEEINKEKIEARYEDGLLKLTLPKKEDAKKAAINKHITVK